MRVFMSVILLVDGLHYLYAGTAGRGQVTIADVRRIRDQPEQSMTGGSANRPSDLTPRRYPTFPLWRCTSVHMAASAILSIRPAKSS